MMQANESIINIYDEALANWHALNERKKKIRTCRGLNPGLSFAGREFYH